MKIAIEGQRLFRMKKHGMDFVALELIRNLMQIDKQNEYYIFVAPGEDRCLEDTENFKIVELTAGSYPQWEQIKLPRAVKKFGCDILHCTSNTAPLFVKVPLVITLHDIIYLEKQHLFNSQATLYQRFGNLYRRFIVPPVFRRSQKVITVSSFEEERIKNWFKSDNNSKVSYIYNGVSEHFSKKIDKAELQEIKKKYQLPDKFFFHLGNTDPKKNTFGVIKAFSEFTKQTNTGHFLVMPDFDRKELERILLKIDNPGLINRIKLTGYIVNTDLPAIYTLSEIFLYPSLRESFGIPILEAMKTGVPVITSDVSSMPEISGDAAILVNPENYSEIALKMIEVVRDDELKNNLKKLGPQNSEKFSWRKMAEDYLDVYSEVFQEQLVVVVT